MRARLVVDASAALPLVVSQPATPLVGEFFSGSSSVSLVAPEFWLLECASVVAHHVRLRLLSKRDGVAALKTMSELEIARIDSSHLVETAFLIGMETAITAYDALYVATADFVDGKLITRDQKLLNALAGSEWANRAVHLSSWRAHV